MVWLYDLDPVIVLVVSFLNVYKQLQQFENCFREHAPFPVVPLQITYLYRKLHQICLLGIVLDNVINSQLNSYADL